MKTTKITLLINGEVAAQFEHDAILQTAEMATNCAIAKLMCVVLSDLSDCSEVEALYYKYTAYLMWHVGGFASVQTGSFAFVEEVECDCCSETTLLELHATKAK